VTKGEVQSLKIPLPPLSEQKQLAALLTDQLAAVSRARQAAEQQLAAADAFPASELRTVFENSIPLTIDKAISASPKGFEWVLLSKVAKLESGHTPSRRHPEWWGGKIPWLALSDIRDLDGKTATETKEYTNELGLQNSSARLLPKGTVCLSRTASVGFVTIMGCPMATSQDFVNWVCGPDLLPDYLMLVLLASRDYIRSLSSGAIHKTVYVPTVEQFKIMMPELGQQRRVVKAARERMETAQKLIPIIQEQLVAIEALPVSLVRSAFSGGK
jgi:type I restriction enzyme S subunit